MMNKFVCFLIGSLFGIAGTLYVISDTTPDQQPVASNNDHQIYDLSKSEQSPQVTCAKLKPLQPTTALTNSSDIDSLLQSFTTRTENLFESQEYKDLSYLIRKDKKVAAQVRNKFLNSDSYDEKFALLNLLSQDSSEETINMVIEMIKKPDDESKRLGFDLLSSMDIKENQPELNNALLDATYNESNPEVLTDVIYKLSEKKLDETTKTMAIDRFQSLLSSSDNTIKARAIDGLSQLGDQETISVTVKRYLHDSDEAVRVSAISAAFKITSGELDNEILSSLTKITNNPQEPESVRNIASAVLESQKSAL